MMGMSGFTVALMMIAVMIFPCIYGKEFSDHQEIKAQRLLKRLNKHALMSIKSEDGDIIDCVPMHSQPAFDHPLLKNHTIQMRPSFIPEVTSTHTKKKTKATQAWHKNGRCPENTVPIRRIKKEDILRSKSIESFGKKTTPSIPEDTTYDPSKGHEYAVMKSMEGTFFGTKFVINKWKPEVQVPNEFSLAQTWLVSGVGTTRNTIEAGLQGRWVPKDRVLQRLPGFVQRSNLITVGGTYTTVSQYNGDQYELSILIWKDGENWWLKVGEELVGYWPGSLFNSLGKGATKVKWGGEIVNSETDGKHTGTDMGSGHFADEGYKKESYFRNLMTVDGTNTLREPQAIYPLTGHDNCYNIKAGAGGTSWGVHFFFGGPGQNEKCP